MEKLCQNCKQQNSAEAQFCRFCASPLATAQGGAPPPPQNPNPQQNQQWNQGFQGNQPAGVNRQPSKGGASGRAIGSLALSICGLLLCCVLTSVPGAILGWMEVNAIKQGQSSPNGMIMAQIGLWGGVVMTVVNLLAYGLYLLLAVSAGMNGY
jgi:hypothetical protein